MTSSNRFLQRRSPSASHLAPSCAAFVAALLLGSFATIGCTDTSPATQSGAQEDAGGSASGTSSAGGGGSGEQDGGATRGGSDDQQGSDGANIDDLGPLPELGEWFECGSRSIDGATVVDGDTFTEDQTWRGLIYVNGSVQIDEGAHLEILAGTKIVVAPGGGVRARQGATLTARGTPDTPILFCGEVAEAASWQGVVVDGAEEYLEDSVDHVSGIFENVLIADAGSEHEGALSVEGAALLRGVQVESSGLYGMSIGAFAEGSERLSFGETERAAVRLLHDESLEHVPTQIDFSRASNDYFELGFEEPGSFTIQTRPVTYAVDDELHVSRMTIEPGVQITATSPVAELFVDELIVQGTEAMPVVLRSSDGWGVVLHAGRGSDIHHLLTDGDAFIAGDETTLDHVTANVLDLEGVQLPSDAETGLSADSQGIVARSQLRVRSSSIWLTLPPDTTLEAERSIDLHFDGIRRAGTVRALNRPYHFFLSHASFGAGADVVLEPGVQLEFPTGEYNLSIHNGGSLTAEGTPAAPIVLRRDESGNFGCGNNWDGIDVDSTAGEVVLRHVSIAYAGRQNRWAVFAERPITLENSTIERSCGDGVVHLVGDDTDYAATNTFIEIIGEDVVAREE